MSIEEGLRFYKDEAMLLPNWDKMTKSELANGCIDAEEKGDELLRSRYYAALVYKYGYMVPYMYKACHSFSDNLGMQPEDFIDWLTESIDVAFKYRRWRDPSNPLSKDKSAPEKIINRCIYSTQKRWFAYYNKDKRRVNAYTYSLEESEELHGDGAEGLMVLEDESSFAYRDVVQNFIFKGEYLKALILDAILYQDIFQQKVKNTKTNEFDENRHPIILKDVKTSFSMRKMVDHLSNLNSKFINYFLNAYMLPNEEEFMSTISKFSSMTRTTYANKIRKSLLSLRDDADILSCVKKGN